MSNIQGPLGFWTFPLLSFMLAALEKIEPKANIQNASQRPLRPVAKNEESWEWVDYKGRPRKLIIHREVKR